MDYLDNLWVADPTTHTIIYISKELDLMNAKFKISGKDGEPGYRNGNLAKASFNGSQSLVVYDRSAVRIKMN